MLCRRDRTGLVYFSRASQTQNFKYSSTQLANVINTSKIACRLLSHCVVTVMWWLKNREMIFCGTLQIFLWNSASLVMNQMGWHPSEVWLTSFLLLILSVRSLKPGFTWNRSVHEGLIEYTDTKGGFINFILDNNPSVCLVHSDCDWFYTTVTITLRRLPPAAHLLRF